MMSKGGGKRSGDLDPTAVAWGFAQWVSSRPAPTRFGLGEDARVAATMVKRFLKANDLPIEPDPLSVVTWPDDMPHTTSIYKDRDRSNAGMSSIQYEALLQGTGEDFGPRERTGWRDESETPDDCPMTRADLEQLLRFVYDTLSTRTGHLSLHLFLHLVLNPDATLSDWAREHGVSAQAAHQRLARLRRKNRIVDAVARLGSSRG